MLNAYLALSSYPNQHSAESFAQQAVTGKLAACAQVLPAMKSFYVWQGQLEQSEEFQLQLKTTAEHLPALEALLIATHPYELPEFIVLPIEKGAQQYLSWLNVSLA